MWTGPAASVSKILSRVVRTAGLDFSVSNSDAHGYSSSWTRGGSPVRRTLSAEIQVRSAKDLQTVQQVLSAAGYLVDPPSTRGVWLAVEVHKPLGHDPLVELELVPSDDHCPICERLPPCPHVGEDWAICGTCGNPADHSIYDGCEWCAMDCTGCDDPLLPSMSMLCGEGALLCVACNEKRLREDPRNKAVPG